MPGKCGSVTPPIINPVVLVILAWLAIGVSTTAPLYADPLLPKPDPDIFLGLLKQKNFRELDSRLSAYQQMYENNSASELDAVNAFQSFARSDPELDKYFNEWVAAYPESYAACLARGIYYQHNGWTRRGSKYIDETSSRQLSGMEEFFQRSTADLEKSAMLNPQSALVYKYMIGIAMASGQHDLARQELDKAVAIDANNSGSRRAYMTSLLPQWGGSYEAMEAFIDETKKYQDNPKLREIVKKLQGDILAEQGRRWWVTKNYEKALKFYSQAVGLIEDPEFLRYRGWLYKDMKRWEEALPDLSKALAINPNDINARAIRGISYARLGKHKEGLDDLLIAAEGGVIWAQERLGTMYEHGEDGVSKNLQEAVKWWRRSAELGSTYSQVALGDAYREGNGVKRDYVEAMKWYRIAAAQGYVAAQATMGSMYWNGWGVAQDKAEAIRLWRLAARQNEPSAKRNLDHLLGYWDKLRVNLEDLYDDSQDVLRRLWNWIARMIWILGRTAP